MTKTYRIDSIGGPMARWLSSIDAAKERYTMSTMEGWRDTYVDDGEPEPTITFEQSTEDEDGQPVPEYTRCMTNGRWDASIHVESPRWPSYEIDHGGYRASPSLVMSMSIPAIGCEHERLVCSDSCLPNEGRPEPRIRCASCGATWDPSKETP